MDVAAARDTLIKLFCAIGATIFSPRSVPWVAARLQNHFYIAGRLRRRRRACNSFLRLAWSGRFCIAGGIERAAIHARFETLVDLFPNAKHRKLGAARQLHQLVVLLGIGNRHLRIRNTALVEVIAGVITRCAALGRGVERDRKVFAAT